MGRFALAGVLMLIASGAAAQTPLDPLYDRIAGDLKAGGRLAVTVYVALCDNDSQGIVPVKNRAICDGSAPDRNIYWGSGGGLAGYMKNHGYRRVTRERPAAGPVLVDTRWHKRLWPGGALRERGVTRPFEVEVRGLAYRGDRIGDAMRDYLRAVNGDASTRHIVGYVGHNYFMDAPDPDELTREHQGAGTLPKGTFALACLSDALVRPAITRDNVAVLILNRQLTYPGAWTIGGILQSIAWGQRPRAIHRNAARHFADGMGKSHGAILRAFAHGP